MKHWQGELRIFNYEDNGVRLPFRGNILNRIAIVWLGIGERFIRMFRKRPQGQGTKPHTYKRSKSSLVFHINRSTSAFTITSLYLLRSISEITSLAESEAVGCERSKTRSIYLPEERQIEERQWKYAKTRRQKAEGSTADRYLRQKAMVQVG
jgi:hypothetical protein